VDTTKLRISAAAGLDLPTAYKIFMLRVAVFVVEQKCAYQELDGRDLEPGTTHVWVEDRGEVIGYLRILQEAEDEFRIGRVCVLARARNSGVAARMMHAAVDQVDPHPCLLDAQSHMAGWYARFGFAPDGEEFVEDGIPHLPMRRRVAS
jgi:ElaA protein